MKSVMQEASTIAKALEQAWIQAGKPEEFTVKILEQPEKNFLGFVKRSAKVAVYFEEKKSEKKIQRPSPRHHRKEESFHRDQTPNANATPERRPQQRQQQQNRDWRNQPRPRRQENESHEREKIETPKAAWSDSMTQFAQQWMRETLESMQHGHVFFTVEPQNLYLRIALHEQLMSDPEQERQILASFATLLLEALKKQFGVPLHGHKIVLTHATAYEKYSR